MAPDRHVARVRRKLPGHHNRRFKGKSPRVDQLARRDQEAKTLRNQLPGAVNVRLDQCRKGADEFQLALVGAATGLLLCLQPQVPPDIWMCDHVLHLTFRDVYVELHSSLDHVEAHCFTGHHREFRVLYDPLSVAAWLHSEIKKSGLVG